MSWHQPRSALPPLLQLRAVVDCVVLEPSAGARQLFLFFYTNLPSKLYSPKIDLETDPREKKIQYSIYKSRTQLFSYLDKTGEAKKCSEDPVCMCDLGVLLLTTLFLPSLPLTPSTKSAFHLLIGLYRSEGSSPHLHPIQPPGSCGRRSKRGRRQSGCITS